MAARALSINPALKTQPLIAVGISRVSLLIQVGNYSIEGQQHQIKMLESKYGFQIPEGYLLDDEGYSGTSMDRPAIRRAMRMIKAGEAQAVVFPYLDRFSRKVEFGLTMIRLFREAGAQVLFGEIGWVDDSAMCKMLVTNLLMIAEMQRDSIAIKSQDGVRTKIAKGLAHGGRSPFGWHFVTALEIAAEALNKGERVPEGKPQNIHKPVPEDIGTMRLMGQLILAGESAKGVCREFLLRGIKSPKGKARWNPTTVSEFVHNLFYSTGIWYYGKRKAIAPKKRRRSTRTDRSWKSWQMRPESEWQEQKVTDTPIWTPEEQQAIIEALERNRVVRVGKPAAEDGLEAQFRNLMVCKRTLPSGEICNHAIVPRQKSTPAGRKGWYVDGNRDSVTGEHRCSTRHYKIRETDEVLYEGLRKAFVEDLDAMIADHKEEICSTVDVSELERLRADEERLRGKYNEARDKEQDADNADDKRYYAGRMSEYKGQLAMLRRRIASFTEEADAAEVDTAAIRREVATAWKTKVPSERREWIVGLVKVVEWISDEEVVMTLRIPRRGFAQGVNGQRDEPLVDHYILLKTKVRVAA